VVEVVTYDDVVAAAGRIAGSVERTPLAHSRTLGAICGTEVFVKFENLQFTASYKERGALNRLLQLPEHNGVVTASAGNFAQGVAHHATRLGLPAAIVMPSATPNVKVARTSVLGAEVVKFGSSFEEAAAHAERLAVERGWQLLSPFDDPEVIAGQGTVALEIVDDLPDVDVVVVPIGGGGLIAGMGVVLRERRPDLELVGVQSERYPGVHNLIHGLDAPIGGTTIAEGVAVANPGAHTLPIIRRCVDRVELVSEALIERAIGLYLEVEKTVAEGAGAVSLAELLARSYAGRKVAVVLSGGNIDMRQLAAVNLRELVRSGRMSTFWVELDDRPGTLGRVTTLVGEFGANIVEVAHRWLDPGVPARSTSVEFTVETTGVDHLAALVAGLEDHGYRVRTSPSAAGSQG
jgi:threonine dehydratase